MPPQLPIGVVDDPRFEDHHASGPHPERPARLQAARRGLYAAIPESRREALAVREATNEELSRVHSHDYIETLSASLAGGEGQLDPDTFFSKGSRQAAWLAAGSCVDMVEALASDRLGAAVALVRPPGHHAERSHAMGFCLLNNVAVAAANAVHRGVERVAIVDWDVHHGNGTQHMFEADPRVLYISTHQAPFYPGTGASEEIGSGDGKGLTANLPLPAGSDAAVYAAAFQQVVVPLLDAFDPCLLLISAGFDAHAHDPLASMALDAEAYAAMTTALLHHCNNRPATSKRCRLGLVLEGGYDLDALRTSVAAVGRALLGHETRFPRGSVPDAASRALQATRRALAPYWPALQT